MKKITVIINETISQEFEVEVDDNESGSAKVRELYQNGKLVVDNPTLLNAEFTILDDNGLETVWDDLN